MSSSTKPTTPKNKATAAKPASARAGSKSAAKSATSPTAKPVTAQSTAPKAAGAASAEPAIIDPPRPVIVGPVMRKKELMDAVVERSGVKKKDAKPVIEAMLDVLGAALADNRELILPPMGKFKVSTEKKLANGRVMRIKVRQNTPPIKPAEPDAAD